MTQLALPMLTVYEGPTLVDPSEVAACQSYREAVKRSWEIRKRTRITNRAIAEETGCCAQHITAYLNDSKYQRDLPAEYIAAWEVCMGNRLVTQWLAARAQLTILETFIQRRAA